LKSLFEPPSGGLRGNVRTPSVARWKARGRLPYYRLRLRRYKRKYVEVSVFRGGWVTLSSSFRRKGTSPINHCCCQKTRVIALSCLSCGIKISPVGCLVFVTKNACDRRTDRQTDGKNCDSQDRANIAASCGNKDDFVHTVNNVEQGDHIR